MPEPGFPGLGLGAPEHTYMRDPTGHFPVEVEEWAEASSGPQKAASAAGLTPPGTEGQRHFSIFVMESS